MSDTRHLEYKQVVLAQRDIEDAIALLHRARHEIAVLSGDHARIIEQLGDAMLEASKALETSRRTISTMGRMWFR